MAIYKVRALFDLGVLGEFAGTGYHLEQSGSFTPGGSEASYMTQQMDAVWDWWGTGVSGSGAAKGLFATTVKLSRVTMQRLDPTIGPVQSDDRADVAGSGGSPSTSPQNAIVVSFRTDGSARRQRGRMFLPPPMEADVDNAGNILTATAQQVADITLSLFQEAESAGRQSGVSTTEHVVWSTRSAAGPPTAFQITTYLVGTRIDTQRRRLGREQAYVTGV